MTIAQGKAPDSGDPCSQEAALWSTRPHLGNLDHGLAELFYLVLTVPDTPEVLVSPVLKQEPRHWGTGRTGTVTPPVLCPTHTAARDPPSSDHTAGYPVCSSQQYMAWRGRGLGVGEGRRR